MADNSQKAPFARSLNQVASRKALDAIQLTGRSLPCSITAVSGWIVEVNFEINSAPFTLPRVRVPVAFSKYDYVPLQIGDKGVVDAADALLGAVSGLGGAAPKLGAIGNLTPLVFKPIGNTAFAAPDNVGYRVVQGPEGAEIRSLDGTVMIKLDRLSGKISITGELWVNGKKYLDHEHVGVTVGAGKSGGVFDP